MEFFASKLEDQKFLDLLKRATISELSNMAQLRESAELFPIHEIGVAQGCCLSPLIGNILLHDFDTLMNGRNIVCFRYVDDFVVLGPNKGAVLKAFHNGAHLLKKHGLTAYGPEEDGGKAASGAVENGFEFLGCEIKQKFVRPTKEKRQRLLGRIDECLNEGRKALHQAGSGERLPKQRLVQTLAEVDNIIRAWAHAYIFCNDMLFMKNLDNIINTKVESFISTYQKLARKADKAGRRRLLGIHLLQDTKFEPAWN